MANYCWSKITASATNSEWKEISTAFSNNQIDWAIGTSGPDCNDWNKEISCENKWSPTPWNEGKMEALSKSYPSVQFYYRAWRCRSRLTTYLLERIWREICS